MCLKMGLCDLDDDTGRWIVPRYAICIFFWSGFLLSFLGGMIIVNAYLAPDPAALTAGGGVLLAVGIVLLVICLVLTFHSYLVVMSAEDNKKAKVNNNMTIIHHPEKQPLRPYGDYEYQRPPGTVTFNAIDSVLRVDGHDSLASRRQLTESGDSNHRDGAIAHKPPPFPRSEGRHVTPVRQPIRSLRKTRPASQPLSPDEIDVPTYGEVTIADSKVSLYDNVQYQWPNKKTAA